MRAGEQPSLHAIEALICVRFGVSRVQLRSERRDREVTRPRQAAMWLARRAGHSSHTIARHFGDRDPTTAIYAARNIDRLMSERPVEWGMLMTELAAEAGGMGTPLEMPRRFDVH